MAVRLASQAPGGRWKAPDVVVPPDIFADVTVHHASSESISYARRARWALLRPPRTTSGGRGQASALPARKGVWWSSGSGYGDPRPFCHHVWWAARSQRPGPAQALCPRPLGPVQGQRGRPIVSIELLPPAERAADFHGAPAVECVPHSRAPPLLGTVRYTGTRLPPGLSGWMISRKCAA